VFLPETQYAARRDDRQDDHPVGELAHRDRQHRGAAEDQNYRAGELRELQP
jgi:hypothetical protein